jgi:hypothetical protein
VKSAREEDPSLTYLQAARLVENFIYDAAAFHAFLGRFWNKCVFPYFNNLSTEQERDLIKLSNNFRDIVDPEHYVPLYFDDER